MIAFLRGLSGLVFGAVLSLVVSAIVVTVIKYYVGFIVLIWNLVPVAGV